MPRRYSSTSQTRSAWMAAPTCDHRCCTWIYVASANALAACAIVRGCAAEGSAQGWEQPLDSALRAACQRGCACKRSPYHSLDRQVKEGTKIPARCDLLAMPRQDLLAALISVYPPDRDTAIRSGSLPGEPKTGPVATPGERQVVRLSH